MEKIPYNKKESADDKKIISVAYGENKEYIIIHVGDRDRYIPKREKTLVEGSWVDTKKLVQAMTIFYEDEPGEALRKYNEMNKENK